jgi:hypothetical protein
MMNAGARASILAMALLCAACQALFVRDAAIAPGQLAGDHCPGASRLMTPAEFEVCPQDLLRRPHIDYGDVLAFTDITYAVMVGYRPLKMVIYMPRRGSVTSFNSPVGQ